jgi:Na+/phosphate symporter
MTITLYLAPLLSLVGVLMYALAGNTKLQEIGRIMFAMALLASLLAWGGSGHALR